MSKTKWMLGAALSIFLGIATFMQVQERYVVWPDARNIVNHSSNVLKPAQLAKITATMKAVEHWDQAAMAAMDAGRYTEVEADARQSVVIDPGFGRGQELLAASLDAQGKSPEALQAYKVISDEGDSQPRNEDAYAMLLLKSGQWPQAVAAYNRTLPCNNKMVLGSVRDDDPLSEISRFSPVVPQPKQLETVLHILIGLNCLGGSWVSHPTTHEEALREFERAWQMQPDSVLTNFYYVYGWQSLDFQSPLKAANVARAQAAYQVVAASQDAVIKKAASRMLYGVPYDFSLVRRRIVKQESVTR